MEHETVAKHFVNLPIRVKGGAKVTAVCATEFFIETAKETQREDGTPELLSLGFGLLKIGMPIKTRRMGVSLTCDHVERAAHPGFDLSRVGESARVRGEQGLEALPTQSAQSLECHFGPEGVVGGCRQHKRLRSVER